MRRILSCILYRPTWRPTTISVTDRPEPALFPSDTDDIGKLSFATVAHEFPIKKRRCYLNNASIGALSLPVIAAVDRFMHDVRDNGRNEYPNWCKYADTSIKQRIARLIGAKSSEIAFIKNTTEGLGFVANGYPWKQGDNVIIADIEYPSNVYCWVKLAKLGVEVRWVKNQQGRIRVDDIRALMDSKTRVVSLSAVQFSNGYRQDLESTAALCNERGVLFNLDGIQWIGALAIDVERLGIHFLSVGGHKWLLAPIGTGFFYCRQAVMDRIEPPTVGYHTVDKHEDHMDYELVYRGNAGRFEEALVNFPGIWGMDAATRMQLALGTEQIQRHILALTSRAVEGLRSRGYEIVSPFSDDERSGIVSFRHRGIKAEDIAERLKIGGVDVAVRGGALRISPSYYNDAQEIDRFLQTLPAS
jgi:cysteine desulfurase / selenocysteine lyase